MRGRGQTSSPRAVGDTTSTHGSERSTENQKAFSLGIIEKRAERKKEDPGKMQGGNKAEGARVNEKGPQAVTVSSSPGRQKPKKILGNALEKKRGQVGVMKGGSEQRFTLGPAGETNGKTH